MVIEEFLQNLRKLETYRLISDFRSMLSLEIGIEEFSIVITEVQELKPELLTESVAISYLFRRNIIEEAAYMLRSEVESYDHDENRCDNYINKIMILLEHGVSIHREHLDYLIQYLPDELLPVLRHSIAHEQKDIDENFIVGLPPELLPQALEVILTSNLDIGIDQLIQTQDSEWVKAAFTVNGFLDQASIEVVEEFLQKLVEESEEDFLSTLRIQMNLYPDFDAESVAIQKSYVKRLKYLIDSRKDYQNTLDEYCKHIDAYGFLTADQLFTDPNYLLVQEILPNQAFGIIQRTTLNEIVSGIIGYKEVMGEEIYNYLILKIFENSEVFVETHIDVGYMQNDELLVMGEVEGDFLEL